MKIDRRFIHEQILQNISGGVMCIEDGRIIYVNPAASQILSKDEMDLTNRFFAEAFFEYPENEGFNQTILDAIYDPTNPHEKIVEFFDGLTMHYLHLETSQLQSETLAIVILIDDITALMNLHIVEIDLATINSHLAEQGHVMNLSRERNTDSEIDELTGLYNQSRMESLCKKYFSDFDSQWNAAFFLIDLDHFTEANEKYGRECGDEILQMFGESLRSNFRSTDFIGRFGSDEFLVLMRDIPSEEIIRIKAEGILQAAREISIEGKDLELTASVGITIVSEQKDYSEIFQAAEESVGVVKSQGRDGYSIDSERKIS